MSPSLPDPYISEGEWDGVQRNFDAVARLMVDTGGQSLGVRVGTATLTWANAAANSATLVVPHGLGRTPVAVVATGNGTGGPNLIVVQAFSIGATSFSLQGGFLTGTATGVTPVLVGWAAIG